MSQNTSGPRAKEHPVVEATWKPGVETSSDGRWVVPADMIPAAVETSQNVTQFYHAVRRHWIGILAAGLLLGGGAAAGVWFGWGSHYTARAVLKVAYQPQVVAFQTAETQQQARAPEAFEVFKDTQIQLIKSDVVLTPALRDPAARELEPIRKRGAAAAEWLADEIEVGFPQEAEIMEVRFTSRDPAEAATLVNAVVEAYLEDVVNRGTQERRERLDKVEQAIAQKDTELREAWNEISRLSRDFGVSEDEAMRLKQQLIQQELADYRREYMRTQFELRRARGELEAQRALLAVVDETEISPHEIDRLLQTDPFARPLAEQIAWKRAAASYVALNVRPEAVARYATPYQSDLQALQAQFEQRAAELQESLRDKQRSEIQQTIREKEIEVAMLVDREEQLRQDVERLEEEARHLGGVYVDVEVARENVRTLQASLRSLKQERDKIEVELQSRPRIELLQRAEPPVVQDGLPVRIALSVLAGLVGLGLPLVGITLWDISASPVNTTADVSRRAGVPVAGSLPRIPPAVLRRLGSPGRRNRLWHHRLTESVDGICARLLREAELHDRRVILVTSAESGEGKSTLATQLAMSLARNGRSTVLVDFDLRHPALAAVFGVSETPGISEVLRGETDLQSVLRDTSVVGMSVITAGQCDRRAITALANGAGGAVFKELREEFDFVVVDSSPVLPVADTRFISQHVDRVLLSVFQDASQVPKISSAREILEAFGVENIEAVVIGSAGGHQDRRLQYDLEATS